MLSKSSKLFVYVRCKLTRLLNPSIKNHTQFKSLDKVCQGYVNLKASVPLRETYCVFLRRGLQILEVLNKILPNSDTGDGLIYPHLSYG